MNFYESIWLFFFTWLALVYGQADFQVGTGIFDITGPAAEVNLVCLIKHVKVKVFSFQQPTQLFLLSKYVSSYLST